MHVTPCSLEEVPNVSEGRTASISTLLVAYLAYSSTLKLQTANSSKTSVHLYQATRRHTPGSSAHHSHRCENLKSSFCTIIPWEGSIPYAEIWVFGFVCVTCTGPGCGSQSARLQRASQINFLLWATINRKYCKNR